MGHERVGFLPRSQRWMQVVAALAETGASGGADVSDVASKTLENVRRRYQGIHKDPGVKAAFLYVLSLSTDCLERSETHDVIGIDLRSNPSSVRIAAKLNAWVTANLGYPEYAEIARRAGGDAIASWTQQQGRQTDLLEGEPSAQRIWQAASDARGFCEVARLFFAKFTERYLRYFLEREASAKLPSLEVRERFAHQLSEHIDAISKHAFETSKITQSFAAGWFNNHARNGHPSDVEVEAFLALSFGKLQEELRRESLE